MDAQCPLKMLLNVSMGGMVKCSEVLCHGAPEGMEVEGVRVVELGSVIGGKRLHPVERVAAQ